MKIKIGANKNFSISPKLSLKKRIQEIDVNPYCKKDFEIGLTRLNHNPILNPCYNFRYNKYLNKEIDNINDSKIKIAGNNIIK